MVPPVMMEEPTAADFLFRAQLAQVAERHRRAEWVLGGHLVIAVWFPYRRWPLVIIVNLPGPIAFRAAVLVITDPPPAITMRTNLHCRLLLVRPPQTGGDPGNCLGATGAAMPPGRVSGPGRRMDNRIARGQVPEARPGRVEAFCWKLHKSRNDKLLSQK